MTLYEFNQKENNEQFNITFNQGEFLLPYLQGSRRYALYPVHKFFVEVENDVESKKILGKTSFIEGEKLDRYSNLPENF